MDRNAIADGMKARIDAWNASIADAEARLSDLRARAGDAANEQLKTASEQVEKMKAMRDSAQADLAERRKATEDTLTDWWDRTEKAWDDVAKGFRAAYSRFG